MSRSKRCSVAELHPLVKWSFDHLQMRTFGQQLAAEHTLRNEGRKQRQQSIDQNNILDH